MKKANQGSCSNYFTKTDTLRIVGGILLVVGILSVWLGFSMSFLGYIFGILLTPAGLVLFFIGSSGRMSDEDIDNIITNKMAGFEIDIDNDRSYQLKLLKKYKEIELEGYLFPDGVMIKRLKSGELRSSLFSRSKIRILSDRLYVLSREISLDDDEKVIDRLFEPRYETVKNVYIERDQKDITFMKNFYLVKTCFFVIETDSETLKLPCLDAITTDEIADTVNRHIGLWRASQSAHSSTENE